LSNPPFTLPLYIFLSFPSFSFPFRIPVQSCPAFTVT
jgi:hypothetical protein